MRFRSIRREDGAAAVEFAIILPVLLVIVFGIIDFGRALFTYNSLNAGVREGARYAATQIAPNAVEDEIRSRVKAYSTNLSGPELADGQIAVSSVTATSDVVTVTVTYAFEPITPIAPWLGFSEITMSPSATFRWERKP